MDRRTTVPAALVAVAGLLVVSACVQGDAEPDTEPAASVGENPEPSVAPPEEVLPLSVRVTDDPPLELQFSRSLTARQRDVVNSELERETVQPARTGDPDRGRVRPQWRWVERSVGHPGRQRLLRIRRCVQHLDIRAVCRRLDLAEPRRGRRVVFVGVADRDSRIPGYSPARSMRR